MFLSFYFIFISVLGFKCYVCNDIAHKQVCQENSTLKSTHTHHIMECTGTCFIAKLGGQNTSGKYTYCSSIY